MVEPDNLEAQDHLTGFALGLALQRMVITLEDFQLISKYLDEQVEEQKQLEFQSQLMSSQIYKVSTLQDLPDDQQTDLDAAIQDAEAAPVIALVNKVLVKALKEKVSDIHIEPQEEYLRMVSAGWSAAPVLRPSAKKIIPAVTARFKIADLDIAERRIPQDGRIQRI